MKNNLYLGPSTIIRIAYTPLKSALNFYFTVNSGALVTPMCNAHWHFTNLLRLAWLNNTFLAMHRYFSEPYHSNLHVASLVSELYFGVVNL